MIFRTKIALTEDTASRRIRLPADRVFRAIGIGSDSEIDAVLVRPRGGEANDCLELGSELAIGVGAPYQGDVPPDLEIAPLYELDSSDLLQPYVEIVAYECLPAAFPQARAPARYEGSLNSIGGPVTIRIPAYGRRKFILTLGGSGNYEILGCYGKGQGTSQRSHLLGSRVSGGSHVFSRGLLFSTFEHSLQTGTFGGDPVGFEYEGRFDYYKIEIDSAMSASLIAELWD